MYEHIERYLTVVPTAYVRIERYPGYLIGLGAYVRAELISPPSSDLCDTVAEVLSSLNRACKDHLSYAVVQHKYKSQHFAPLSEEIFDTLLDDRGPEIRLMFAPGLYPLYVCEYWFNDNEKKPRTRHAAETLIEALQKLSKNDRPPESKPSTILRRK
jgi:hypothetical protein